MHVCSEHTYFHYFQIKAQSHHFTSNMTSLQKPEQSRHCAKAANLWACCSEAVTTFWTRHSWNWFITDFTSNETSYRSSLAILQFCNMNIWIRSRRNHMDMLTCSILHQVLSTSQSRTTSAAVFTWFVNAELIIRKLRQCYNNPTKGSQSNSSTNLVGLKFYENC